MSHAIIDGPRASFEFTYSLLNKFIEVCPDTVWTETFGGWPVWQQIYHSFDTIGFFVMSVGEEPEAGLYPPAVAHMEKDSAPATPPTKEAILAYGVKMKAKADAYIAGLTDAVLANTNEGLSSRMRSIGIPQDFSHSKTLGLLSGHFLYHLGVCDSALRQKGLPGVF